MNSQAWSTGQRWTMPIYWLPVNLLAPGQSVLNIRHPVVRCAFHHL